MKFPDLVHSIKPEPHHAIPQAVSAHDTFWDFIRELWIESLGLPAVLPPPEEVKKVETAIGASRAEHLRDDMLQSKH